MKNLLITMVILFLAVTIQANNLQITGISVDQTAQTVSFNMSWDNSWYVSTAPNNWDAVWVFVKFRNCAASSATPFTHGILSSTTSDHTFTGLQPMSSVNWNGTTGNTNSTVQGAALDFTDGVILRRSSVGQGTTSASVTLKVTNMPAAGTDISLNVYGIEMVYIPSAEFYIGDGDGSGNGSTYRFLSAANNSSVPISVAETSETGVSTFYTMTGPTTISNIPAAWPKGYYGFYAMKYEITQGMYAEFLNTIGGAAASARYPGSFGSNRNMLTSSGGAYSSTRPDRAQNFLSWADVSAFLDWSCLRPMTETEYEKAVRVNSGAYLTNEYAWGSTSISAANTFNAPATEDGTETFNSGNSVYSNQTYANGDAGTGPARAGIFATATSDREAAGATTGGVLDMSGNVREVVVALSSTVASDVFTRTWGDGALDASGNHNVTSWPAAAITVTANVTTNLVGHRGGCWYDAAALLQVSSRTHIYNAPNIGRTNYNGGRGVR